MKVGKARTKESCGHVNLCCKREICEGTVGGERCFKEGVSISCLDVKKSERNFLEDIVRLPTQIL